MIVRVIIFIVACIVPLTGYSGVGAAYRDPFCPVLPPIEDFKGDIEVIERYTGSVEKVEVLLPDLIVEGVLWGSKIPQTIIDGEVYKVGDKLNNVGGTISKIEKSTVFISYEGEIHEIKVQKREGK